MKNATLLFVIGFIASATFAAPPSVSRVEPPSWWIGHSCNPLRLLISGEHLSKARLEAPPGFDVGAFRSSENGSYLFADLRIPENSQPGVVSLRVVTDEGEARVPFKLLARQSGVRRVQGVSERDVIYLIMIDRFADGDTANDDPGVATSPGGRSRLQSYHGGDFLGILNRLDYLRDLGVTTLWLTPWYDNVNHLVRSQPMDRASPGIFAEPSFASSAASSAPVVTNQVTFQVDMLPSMICGMFDPKSDRVAVRGSFNRFSATANLCTPSSSQSGIYTNIALIVDRAGTKEEYKFWCSSPAKAADQGYENPNPMLSPTVPPYNNRYFVQSKSHSQVLPVLPFNDLRLNQSYHGYGVVDFYATDEHFGSLPLLARLIDRAHAFGFKVVQDQVANHTSAYHPWVIDPPTPTWFNGSVTNHLQNTFQTWTVVATNPPADQLKATLEGWFFNSEPDLNQNDPEVATYLIQNSLWWIGMTGVDAVRQDALPYVPRSFWSRWAAAIKREHPRLTIFGEMWDPDPKRVAFFQGGQRRFDGVDSGVDGMFDFPLNYASRQTFCHGASMSDLTRILAADREYVNPAALVTFLGLHDQPRFLSEPGATPQALKLAFTFLLTTRGIPTIYYGDEIGMRGLADPDNRRDFPGGWGEDTANAFQASGRTLEQAGIHDYVKRLLQLRQEITPLQAGRLVNLSVNRDTYVFARMLPEAWAIVAFNNSPRRQRLQVPVVEMVPPANTVTDRLGPLGTIRPAHGTLNLTLPPRTAALLTP